MKSFNKVVLKCVREFVIANITLGLPKWNGEEFEATRPFVFAGTLMSIPLFSVMF